MNSKTIIYSQIAKTVTSTHRRYRKKFFAPIVGICLMWGITPMLMTQVRLLFVLPIIFFLKAHPFVASGLIFLGLFTDWLDGPIARATHKDSDRGKFIDLFVDNIFYAGVILGMMSIGVINMFWGAYHLVLTATFHVVSVINRNEGKKTDWIIKPDAISGQYKAIVYIIIFLYLIFSIDTVNITLWLVTVIMTIEALYHYVSLVRRWRRLDNSSDCKSF